MAVLMAAPYSQFLDDDGNPLSGGKIYSYEAGTTTPKATFTDSSGTILATNPVVLDAAGRAAIWIQGSYNIRVEDANGVHIRTTPNVVSTDSGAGDTDGIIGARNRLINPSGAVYSLPVAATSNDKYFADCWYVLSQTGGVNPSALTDPEAGYPTGIRIIQSQVTAQRFGFAQIIEGKNCKDMRDSNTVLTARLRISNSQPIRYAILGWTGTENAVTSDVVNNWNSTVYTPTGGSDFFVTLGGTVAVGVYTPPADTWTTLPDITKVMGNTENNLIVFIWTEGTAALNFAFDFDFVGLATGSKSPLYEPRSIQQEIALCRRYHPLWDAGSASVEAVAMGQCISSTNANIILPLEVTPLRPPTGITVSSASHFSVRTAGSAAEAVTGMTIGAGGMKAIAVSATVAGNLVSGNATRLFTASNASAKIIGTGSEL